MFSSLLSSCDTVEACYTGATSYLTGSNFYEIKFEHCWQNNHLISKLMGGGQFYHAQIITWLSMALLCQDVQMQKTFPENQLTLYSKIS